MKTRTIEHVLMVCACCAGLVLQSEALTIGDAYYLGQIVNGAPANATNEVEYINYLTTLSPGASSIQIPAGTGEFYDRTNSTVAGPFPTAITSGNFKQSYNDSPNNPETFNFVGSFHYILAKYGGESLVWFNPVGFTGLQTIPNPHNNQVSHVSGYNAAATRVPDVGSAIALLGIAISGLSIVRRKLC